MSMNLTGYGYRRATQSSGTATGTVQSRFESAVSDRSAHLTDAALRLMGRLENKVVLHEIPAKFPRVLNQIAAVWDRPSEANRCFDALLFDARGTRQGFPPPVASELASLRLFYTTRVFPQKIDPWDQALLR